MGKWELKWQGQGDPQPSKPDAVIHACGDDIVWWEAAETAEGKRYVAVVTADTVEQAWSKIKATCKIDHRLGKKQMPDDWKPRIAIGLKGFRVTAVDASFSLPLGVSKDKVAPDALTTALKRVTSSGRGK